MNITEAQFVSEHITGDDAVLNELVARHLTLTYRFVYNMTGNVQYTESFFIKKQKS